MDKVDKGLQAMTYICRPDGVCVLEARQMTVKVKSGRTVEQVVAERVICFLKVVWTMWTMLLPLKKMRESKMTLPKTSLLHTKTKVSDINID